MFNNEFISNILYQNITISNATNVLNNVSGEKIALNNSFANLFQGIITHISDLLNMIINVRKYTIRFTIILCSSSNSLMFDNLSVSRKYSI